MKLLINNQEINFTLENEKQLGEVIREINKWLGGSGLNITEIRVNDRIIDPEKESQWEMQNIEEIETLSVTVTHISELRVTNLETVIEYLNLLERAIENKDKNLYSELMPGFQFMIESLRENFLLDSVFPHDLSTLSQLTPENLAPMEVEEQEMHINTIKEIKKTLVAAINDIKNPKETLKELTEQLKKVASEISEVSILLQTGKDREAMENIVRFSNLTGRFFRIISAMGSSGIIDINNLKIGEEDSKKFYADLNANLKELIEAFKLNDSVLIGDLLEYEIAPRIELLIALAEEIQES